MGYPLPSPSSSAARPRLDSASRVGGAEERCDRRKGVGLVAAPPRGMRQALSPSPVAIIGTLGGAKQIARIPRCCGWA